jgi:hypothetical protein
MQCFVFSVLEIKPNRSFSIFIITFIQFGDTLEYMEITLALPEKIIFLIHQTTLKLDKV